MESAWLCVGPYDGKDPSEWRKPSEVEITIYAARELLEADLRLSGCVEDYPELAGPLAYLLEVEDCLGFQTDFWRIERVDVQGGKP